MRTRQPQSLQTILGRRLIIIAAAVILANIAFVAFFDASDRPSLISDVTTSELKRLELALKTNPEDVGDMNARVSDIYRLHPEAYGFAIVDAGGTLIASTNVDLFPDGVLRGSHWHRTGSRGRTSPIRCPSSPRTPSWPAPAAAQEATAAPRSCSRCGRTPPT